MLPLLASLLTTALLCAQAEPAKTKPSSKRLTAELAALEARAAKAGNGLEASNKVRPDFEQFAKAHAGTEEALTAKLWLLQQTWWTRDKGGPADAKRRFDELLAEYPGSKQLAKVAEYQYVFAPADKSAVLEQLLAKSAHAEVQAEALLALAVQDKTSKDTAAQELSKQRFATLLEKHADLPRKYTTYGELAKAHTSPLAPADLAVGKTMPEITGKDHKGKPMKLSDHRGKVVVIDFWGFW